MSQERWTIEELNIVNLKKNVINPTCLSRMLVVWEIQGVALHENFEQIINYLKTELHIWIKINEYLNYYYQIRLRGRKLSTCISINRPFFSHDILGYRT